MHRGQGEDAGDGGGEGDQNFFVSVLFTIKIEPCRILANIGVGFIRHQYHFSDRENANLYT